MEKEVTFEAYLNTKKIDAEKFSKEERELFTELKDEFDQMHPNSFTQQKLFLINPLRRKYTYQQTSNQERVKPIKKVFKPKF